MAVKFTSKDGEKHLIFSTSTVSDDFTIEFVDLSNNSYDWMDFSEQEMRLMYNHLRVYFRSGKKIKHFYGF